MADYAETLFQAVDILLNKKIEQIKFDQTIKATVIDTSKADIGEYLVSTGEAKFTAYSTETKYRENETVMVTIPQGDYNNQKIIIGKYVDNSNTPKAVITPFDSIIDLTNNLIKNDSFSSNLGNEISLWANDWTQNIIEEDEPIHSGYEWILEHAFKSSTVYTQQQYWWEYWPEEKIQGYSVIGLRAQFSTWLAEYGTYQGNYGLALELIFDQGEAKFEVNKYKRKAINSTNYIPNTYYKNNGTNEEPNMEIISDNIFPENIEAFYELVTDEKQKPTTSIVLTFDSDEFFGNVYAFDTYYTQEAVFDISDYKDYPIIGLKLYPYQRQNFKGTDEILGFADSVGYGDFSTVNPNIFLKDPFICFGQFANTFNNDTAELLCENLVYNKNGYLEEYVISNDKEKQENKDYYMLNYEQVSSPVLADINTYYEATVTSQGVIFNPTTDTEIKQKIYYIKLYNLILNPSPYMFKNKMVYVKGKVGRNSDNLKIVNLRWVHKDDNTGQIAVVEEQTDGDRTIPDGYEIRWYYHKTGAQSPDAFAGAHWARYYGIAENVDENTGSWIADNSNDTVTNHTIIKFQPNVNNQNEQLKVIIVKTENGIEKKVVESNILEFTNDTEIRNQASLIDLNALSIKYVDEGGSPSELIGTYFLYDLAGVVINNLDQEIRFLQGVFDPNETDVYKKGDLNENNTSFIQWTFPSKSEQPNFEPCIWDETQQRYITTELRTFNTSRVAFKINKNLNRYAYNNTVYLDVIIDGLSYRAETTMVFGTSGTSGSDYTIELHWRDNKEAIDVSPNILSILNNNYPNNLTNDDIFAKNAILEGDLILRDQSGHIVELENPEWNLDWLVSENTVEIETNEYEQLEPKYNKNKSYYPIYHSENEVIEEGFEDEIIYKYYFIWDQDDFQNITYTSDGINGSNSQIDIDNIYYFNLNKNKFERFNTNVENWKINIGQDDNDQPIYKLIQLYYYTDTMNENKIPIFNYEKVNYIFDEVSNDENLNILVENSSDTIFIDSNLSPINFSAFNEGINNNFPSISNLSILQEEISDKFEKININNENIISPLVLYTNNSNGNELIKEENVEQWIRYQKFYINELYYKNNNDFIKIKNANILNFNSTFSDFTEQEKNNIYKELYFYFNAQELTEETTFIANIESILINENYETVFLGNNYCYEVKNIETGKTEEYYFLPSQITKKELNNFLIYYQDKYTELNKFYIINELVNSKQGPRQSVIDWFGEVLNTLEDYNNNNDEQSIDTLKKIVARDFDYLLTTEQQRNNMPLEYYYSSKIPNNDNKYSIISFENENIWEQINTIKNNISNYYEYSYSKNCLNQIVKKRLLNKYPENTSNYTFQFKLSNNGETLLNETKKYFLLKNFNSSILINDGANFIKQYYNKELNANNVLSIKPINDLKTFQSDDDDDDDPSTIIIPNNGNTSYEYVNLASSFSSQMKLIGNEPQHLNDDLENSNFTNELKEQYKNENYAWYSNFYQILTNYIHSIDASAKKLQTETGENIKSLLLQLLFNVDLFSGGIATRYTDFYSENILIPIDGNSSYLEDFYKFLFLPKTRTIYTGLINETQSFSFFETSWFKKTEEIGNNIQFYLYENIYKFNGTKIENINGTDYPINIYEYSTDGNKVYHPSSLDNNTTFDIKDDNNVNYTFTYSYNDEQSKIILTLDGEGNLNNLNIDENNVLSSLQSDNTLYNNQLFIREDKTWRHFLNGDVNFFEPVYIIQNNNINYTNKTIEITLTSYSPILRQNFDKIYINSNSIAVDAFNKSQFEQRCLNPWFNIGFKDTENNIEYYLNINKSNGHLYSDITKVPEFLFKTLIKDDYQKNFGKLYMDLLLLGIQLDINNISLINSNNKILWDLETFGRGIEQNTSLLFSDSVTFNQYGYNSINKTFQTNCINKNSTTINSTALKNILKELLSYTINVDEFYNNINNGYIKSQNIFDINLSLEEKEKFYIIKNENEYVSVSNQDILQYAGNDNNGYPQYQIFSEGSFSNNKIYLYEEDSALFIKATSLQGKIASSDNNIVFSKLLNLLFDIYNPSQNNNNIYDPFQDDNKSEFLNYQIETLLSSSDIFQKCIDIKKDFDQGLIQDDLPWPSYYLIKNQTITQIVGSEDQSFIKKFEESLQNVFKTKNSSLAELENIDIFKPQIYEILLNIYNSNINIYERNSVNVLNLNNFLCNYCFQQPLNYEIYLNSITNLYFNGDNNTKEEIQNLFNNNNNSDTNIKNFLNTYKRNQYLQKWDNENWSEELLKDKYNEYFNNSFNYDIWLNYILKSAEYKYNGKNDNNLNNGDEYFIYINDNFISFINYFNTSTFYKDLIYNQTYKRIEEDFTQNNLQLSKYYQFLQTIFTYPTKNSIIINKFNNIKDKNKEALRFSTNLSTAINTYNLLLNISDNNDTLFYLYNGLHSRKSLFNKKITPTGEEDPPILQEQINESYMNYIKELLVVYLENNISFYKRETSNLNERYFIYHNTNNIKLFIKKGNYFILDPYDSYNSNLIYYYPILTTEKEIETGLLDWDRYDNNETSSFYIYLKPNNNTYQDVDYLNSLSILQVQLTNFGDYDLTACFPIPLKTGTIIDNENNQIIQQIRNFQGASEIWYPITGTPEYIQSPYLLNLQKYENNQINITQIKHLKTETFIDSEDNNNSINYIYKWNCFYVKDPQEKNNFLPSMSENGVLQPISIYINDAKNYGVQCCKYRLNQNDEEELIEILWSQPIYVYQDRYPSTTVNKWNGKDLILDDDKGIILTAAFAAGRKDSNNKFSGVMLGDWSVDTVSPQLSKQTGIYGFHEGEVSYAFTEDGRGFIGKNGKGRITFNGDSGVISSANWEGNNANGMALDIDDGDIIMRHNYKDTFSPAYNAKLLYFPNGIFNSNNNTIELFKDKWGTPALQVTDGETFEQGVTYYIKQTNLRYVNLGVSDKNHKTYPLSIGTTQSISSRNFKVDWTGTAYIENGIFKGKITGSEVYTTYLQAYEGDIGNWTISRNEITGVNTVLNSQNGITTNTITISANGSNDEQTIGVVGYLTGKDGDTGLGTNGIGISTKGSTKLFLRAEGTSGENYSLSIRGGQGVWIEGKGGAQVTLGPKNGNSKARSPYGEVRFSGNSIYTDIPADQQFGIYARFA